MIVVGPNMSSFEEDLGKSGKMLGPDTTTSCDCFPRTSSILTRPGVCGVWNFYHCQFHAEYQAIAYESLVLHYVLPCNTTLHCTAMDCTTHMCFRKAQPKKRSFPFKYSYHATNTKSRYTQFFSQSWEIIGFRRSANFNLFFKMTIAPLNKTGCTI